MMQVQMPKFVLKNSSDFICIYKRIAGGRLCLLFVFIFKHGCCMTVEKSRKFL